ncbi:RIFT barrel domain-containing protein [Mangrovitalea sediminis]|uniref:RIFT barrel domain-containing protein n=1 Tax=Mangrovitalea sediminis TaxID=1982043 RepID=UPI000BE5E995|nr:hypothetical protein [Mangrovitalea sediminis]
MHKAVSIRVSNKLPHSLSGVPQTIGVPYPQGQLSKDQSCRLINGENGEACAVQTMPLAYWPDGSVRWLKVRFIASPTSNATTTYQLEFAENAAELAPPLKVEHTGNILCVSNGKHIFAFDRQRPGWLQTQEGAEQPSTLSFALSDALGAPCAAVIKSPWSIREAGSVCVRLEMSGYWQNPQGDRLADFSSSVEIFRDSDTVTASLCLHNPKRARHPGGLWDLGDPGSIHFRSLTASLESPAPGTGWLRAAIDQPEAETGAPLRLYQDSSGGEHWNSRNHIGADGKLTVSFPGYKVSRGEKQIAEGLRATPTAGLMTAIGSFQASLDRFWQNFPSAIGVTPQSLDIALFPEETALPYELQGGERKNQTFYLHYGDSPNALDWTQSPPVPSLDPVIYEQAQAFPWFKANAPKTGLDDLIQAGIEGPSNFFQKREIIDEYGWRNFGDLFADHETLYQGKDEQPFISHYNNQYDPIYGFARQFALSGDPRWFQLMDDLARHVVDIDIYHTQEDRAEYNNGLFWHTDHYLDASTATHRTFTRHNDTSSTPGQTGGGPAEEHCYSTGLLYHYLMTGDETARTAVLELANWITSQREGDTSILGQLDLVRRRDLPSLIHCVKGRTVSNRQYAFTRGTGNYLNTLIDASLIDPSGDWLHQAARVIAATVHPDDDPNDRNLLDVEVAWSYLVFLASLSRYINLKLERSEIDDALIYARNALQLYCQWIMNCEVPFLTHPEQLEFPNHTWTAQDIRKAALLYQAASFFPESATDFYGKALEWQQHITDTLTQTPERQYTRVLVILLQNYGPQGFTIDELQSLFQDQLAKLSPSAFHRLSPSRIGFASITLRILKRLLLGLRHFSIKREKAWLSIRMGR